MATKKDLEQQIEKLEKEKELLQKELSQGKCIPLEKDNARFSIGNVTYRACLQDGKVGLTVDEGVLLLETVSSNKVFLIPAI